MARILSPGDVVAYSDDRGIMRNALALRVYSNLGNGAGPLVDLVYVIAAPNPAMYPTTIRRALVHPERTSSNPDGTYYAPVILEI